METKDRKQIGKIELFSPRAIIEIRPFIAAKHENLRGTYLIDSQDGQVVDRIKTELTSPKIGFELTDEPQTSAWKELANQEMNQFLIIVLVIVLMLIMLSFLYYILLNFKELAIRKMFGYTNKELIFKRLIIENIRIHGISLGLVAIGQGIALYFYNHWQKWLSFSGEWMVWQLLFTIGSILLGMITYFMVYHIRIGEMLKNRKPLKLVQFLNYSSKFIFSLLLVVLFIQLLDHYLELKAQTANKEKWETTKHYAFYEYQNSSTGDRAVWEYETGLKSQKLFELASQKGAMLVKPSNGIVFKEMIENQQGEHPSIGGTQNEKEYDPDEGNALQVNGNYLKNNPVYDLNGKRVEIQEEYGDYLIILVPQKYRAQENELLKRYKDWYQFKRYIDEDMYLKRMGKKAKPHQKVEVKIVYIRDGQRHFLYHPELAKENQNYIKDSVLVLINSRNMGGDSYLNYMTNRYFFPYVTKPENPVEELREDIALAGLKETIVSTPSLYSVVDEYLVELERELTINLFLGLVILIVEIVITVFLVLNYLERNKLIHAVKKLSGFSFFKRHLSFIGMVVLLWILLGVGGWVLNLSDVKTLTLLIAACLVVEGVLVYAVIKVAERKKTKDVLKGA